ncbi:MAG TPA: DoxX family protein [Ktedonosporobacter sp.]|nr:DoxX family protein [Ktedonosporobacter sp.]
MSASLSLGLLLLRVVVGLIVAAHGSQKLLGWFGGHGFAGTTGWLQSQGFKPAWFWSLLGGVGEFGGGLLLALGFLTPLGVIGVSASMLMAVVRFHGPKGFWGQKGGYEYPLTLGLMSLVLGLTGPGSYSIDAAIGFALPGVLFLLGLVLAIIVDAIGIVTSRQPAAQQSAA